MNPERRAFQRKGISAKVTLTVEGGTVENSMTRDISRGGCFITTATDIAEGTNVGIEIGFPSGSMVKATGRVAWVRATGSAKAPRGIGVGFVEIDAAALDVIGRLAGAPKKSSTMLGVAPPSPAVIEAALKKKADAAKIVEKSRERELSWTTENTLPAPASESQPPPAREASPTVPQKQEVDSIDEWPDEPPVIEATAPPSAVTPTAAAPQTATVDSVPPPPADLGLPSPDFVPPAPSAELSPSARKIEVPAKAPTGPMATDPLSQIFKSNDASADSAAPKVADSLAPPPQLDDPTQPEPPTLPYQEAPPLPADAPPLGGAPKPPASSPWAIREAAPQASPLASTPLRPETNTTRYVIAGVAGLVLLLGIVGLAVKLAGSKPQVVIPDASPVTTIDAHVDEEDDATTVDATFEASTLATGDLDASVDDATVDASHDGGKDGGHDGGRDGGRDAGHDAGRDAGRDAGKKDAGKPAPKPPPKH